MHLMYPMYMEANYRKILVYSLITHTPWNYTEKNGSYTNSVVYNVDYKEMIRTPLWLLIFTDTSW